MTYDQAMNEVNNGRGEARALWILVLNETERDHFALRPLTWEGSGEYRAFVIYALNDGLPVLIKTR